MISLSHLNAKLCLLGPQLENEAVQAQLALNRLVATSPQQVPLATDDIAARLCERHEALQVNAGQSGRERRVVDRLLALPMPPIPLLDAVVQGRATFADAVAAIEL